MQRRVFLGGVRTPRQAGKKARERQEAEIGMCCLEKPRNGRRQQKLEEARKDPPPEPLEGVWPRRHLDFGRLASSAVREHISAVVSHPVCGNSLQQPQVMTTTWKSKQLGGRGWVAQMEKEVIT